MQQHRLADHRRINQNGDTCQAQIDLNAISWPPETFATWKDGSRCRFQWNDAEKKADAAYIKKYTVPNILEWSMATTRLLLKFAAQDPEKRNNSPIDHVVAGGID